MRVANFTLIKITILNGNPDNQNDSFEAYLGRLKAALEAGKHQGTMVKGGAEGTRIMPENMTHDLFVALEQIGQGFGETGQLDPLLLRGLAKPERYPAYMTPVFKILLKLPAAQFYWNGQLKQNGAYERRFDRPLA